MQPNQPDFNPNQPVTPPQTQPVEPQFGAPTPYTTPTAAPAAQFEPLAQQPLEAPVETFNQAPISAAPVETAFTPVPAPVAPAAPVNPLVNDTLSPAPVLVTKKSHKVLIILLVAVIALVIVVGGVYAAFTMSGNSL